MPSSVLQSLRWPVRALLFCFLGMVALAMPFTFQGRLVDGAAPANGNYEMRFRLFDQPVGGGTVGLLVSMPSVPVTNGLFTVSLEFGAGVFNGASRWLEIAARPVGSVNPLEVLDPRQPVTAVPYALFALAGSGDASTLTTGLLPDARLSGNIARAADVQNSSNVLVLRLVATNTAIQGQLATLARITDLNASSNVLVVRLDATNTLIQGQIAALPKTADVLNSSNVLVLRLAATNTAIQGQLATLARITDLNAASNVLVVRLDATNTLIQGQIAALPKAADVLNSSNVLVLRLAATNTAIQGQLASLARITDLNASSNVVMARLDATNAQIQAQIAALPKAADVLNSSNVLVLRLAATNTAIQGQLALLATASQLTSLSNLLSAQLQATNAALQAQINQMAGRLDQLTAALLTVSNQVQVTQSPGSTAASSDPADASLLGRGFGRFSTLEAPSWRAGSTSGSPLARSGHSAVWTGQSWLIWGGNLGGGLLSDTGAAYDAAGDDWSILSELNSPAPRQGHSAVWTGNAMLVWGGLGSLGPLGSGASYQPGTGNWSALPTNNAPAARHQHVTAWTGARMIVWGGRNAGGVLADGAIFDPVASAWAGLPTTGAPEARLGAVGVWTGSQFIVWGGQGALGELNSGARLPLSGGTTPGAWGAVTLTGAPGARVGHTMVWTGSRVIVWGGKQGGTALNTGGIYDPTADSWSPLVTTGAPTARFGHVAVWTGEEMLVFGGQTGSNDSSAVSTGGAFNPATGRWRPLSSGGGPLARTEAAGLWTGTEFLVFGGTSGTGPLAALQRLNPQPTWYLYRKP